MKTSEYFILETAHPLAGRGETQTLKEWKRVYGYPDNLLGRGKLVPALQPPKPITTNAPAPAGCPKPPKQLVAQPTYEESAIESLRADLAQLLERTKHCRIDMHEPDEQNIYAVVTGTHLDNAFGDNPNHNNLEYTVGISGHDGEDRTWFNLATLIALARLAKL